jgi:hypothetical protein
VKRRSLRHLFDQIPFPFSFISYFVSRSFDSILAGSYNGAAGQSRSADLDAH